MDATKKTCSNLYAGFGRACITPKKSVKLDGYPRVRYSNDVLDDIYASCTALKDEKGTVVLFYELDLLYMSEKNATACRKLIAQAVGVDYRNVFLCCSHTHTAPCDFEIIDLLEEKFVEAAKLAMDDLSPCKLYGGANEVKDMNFVRRYICDDGKIYTGGPVTRIVRHETEGDHQLQIIKFEREGKKDIVFVNWTAHADSIVSMINKPYVISADWLGSTRAYVEKRNDAYLSIFVGAAGDMGTISYIRGEGNLRWNGYYEYGIDLGMIIQTEMKKLEEIDSSKGIKVTSEKIEAQVDKELDHLWSHIEPLLEKYNAGEKEAALEGLSDIGLKYTDATRAEGTHWMGDYEKVELSAVSVGDVGFAVAPYEMFSGTGIEIKAASKFGRTFICTCSNGRYGYLATASSFPNEGYGVHNRQFVLGTGEKFGGAFAEMLNELHG